MTRIEVRDKRQPGHFWADNEVYTKYGPTIGIDGFAVYMALCQYANEVSQAWPSVATLAKQLGAAPNTIRKALGKLDKAGLITITERPRDTDHKVAQTNVYTLLKVDKSRGTSPDEVPHDMQYGVLHDVNHGTSPDEVGVLHDVKRNKTQENKTKRISGGVASPSQTTPPPQGRRESDAALRGIGCTHTQIAEINAARCPLSTEEIKDLPAEIARLRSDPKKRSPVGIIVSSLKEGQTIPHPTPPPSSLSDAARSAIEAERLAGLARWERENARGY
jgi:hypothetical protein